MTIFLIGLVAAIDASADRVDDLSVLSAFEHPSDVCRVILRNDGARAVDLSEIEILDGREARLPVLWVFAEPPIVRPGDLTYVTYRFEKGRNVLKEGLENHVLRAQGVQCPYPAPGRPPLAVSYLVHDASLRRVYLYLRNPGVRAHRVLEVTLDGRPLGLEAAVDIEAGSKNLVVGQWEGQNPSDDSVPLQCVEVDVSEIGKVTLPARLFRPEHAPKTSMINPSPTFRCPSHRYGPPREAGREVVAAFLAASGSARTLAFCNVDLLSDALELFSPISERCRIEPQPAFSNDCWAGNHVKPTWDCARQAKVYAEPGIFYPVLFPEYIHREYTPPFALSAIRDIAYTCFAAGAKGATLWYTDKRELPRDFSHALQRLSNELDRLHPLISIAEPVPWVDVGDDAWCTAHLLLCGDQGFLLILLPQQDNREKQDATVSFRIPDDRWTPAAQADEVGGLHERMVLNVYEEFSTATVEQGDQTRVFFIPFLGIERLPEGERTIGNGRRRTGN